MVPNHHRQPAAKGTGRIRKETFKPRPSGDGVGRGCGGWKTGFRGAVEEDECGASVSVFFLVISDWLLMSTFGFIFMFEYEPDG